MITEDLDKKVRLTDLHKAERNLIKLFRRLYSEVVEVQIRDGLPAVLYSGVSYLMEKPKIQDHGEELTQAEKVVIIAITEIGFGTLTASVECGQPRILPELSKIRIDLDKFQP